MKALSNGVAKQAIDWRGQHLIQHEITHRGPPFNLPDPRKINSDPSTIFIMDR